MTEPYNDLELTDDELEQALIAGERAPAWLLVDSPAGPPAGLSPNGQAALRELVRPLEPAVRARLVDQSIDACTSPASPANVVAAPVRRRISWTLLPLAAAAVVALVFSSELLAPRALLRPAELAQTTAHHPRVAGETLLRPAKRGEPHESTRVLHLAPRDNLYLDCKVPGGAPNVMAIQASRGVEQHDLEFKAVVSDAGLTVLHVRHPDLPQGAWDLHCGVEAPDGGTLWVDPPATLVLE